MNLTELQHNTIQLTINNGIQYVIAKEICVSP